MIADGEKVTVLRHVAFTHDHDYVSVIRATVVRGHAIDKSAPVSSASRRLLGLLDPVDEGTKWCRGWDGPAVRALLTVAALTS